jgi:hypothetical protein
MTLQDSTVGKVLRHWKFKPKCVIMVIAKGAKSRTLPTAALFADVSVKRIASER